MRQHGRVRPELNALGKVTRRRGSARASFVPQRCSRWASDHPNRLMAARRRDPRTPFGLIVLVRLARDRGVMGARPISTGLAIAGWMVAIVVGGFGLLLVIAALTGN